MDELEEIKKLVKDKKFIIGTSSTMKKMKMGKVKKVWLTSNTPKDVQADVVHYAGMNNVEVHTLAIPNDELGTICKKQFSVSVASVEK